MLFILSVYDLSVLAVSRMGFHKTKTKLDRGVGGWVELYPFYFWIFDFFLTLQSPLVGVNIRLTRINSLEGKCTLPDITDEYVQKQISSMSVGKATGPDGISVNMLHIASMNIIKYLTHN